MWECYVNASCWIFIQVYIKHSAMYAPVRKCFYKTFNRNVTTSIHRQSDLMIIHQMYKKRPNVMKVYCAHNYVYISACILRMKEHFVVRDSEYVKYCSVLHQDQYYHVIHHIGVGWGRVVGVCCDVVSGSSNTLRNIIVVHFVYYYSGIILSAHIEVVPPWTTYKPYKSQYDCFMLCYVN